MAFNRLYVIQGRNMWLLGQRTAKEQHANCDIPGNSAKVSTDQ
jgi:hypothetical protein